MLYHMAKVEIKLVHYWKRLFIFKDFCKYLKDRQYKTQKKIKYINEG